MYVHSKSCLPIDDRASHLSKIRTNPVAQVLWLIRNNFWELEVKFNSKFLKFLDLPVCRGEKESCSFYFLFSFSFTEKDTMDVWCNGQKMETAVRGHFQRLFTGYG